MATVLMKQILTIAAVMFTLHSSAHALENADVTKLVADLKSDNPQVRAKAVTQLTPIYIEITKGFSAAREDKDPEVAMAFKAFIKAINDAMQATPAGARSRMAANETVAVAMCKAYCTAQDIYRRTDYNKDGVLEYAQALKGKNSLYETEAGTGDLGLIDKSVANAEGAPSKAIPKAGYCLKILTRQGSNAGGGARNYVLNGHMNLGYALVAYPAEYDKSGKYSYLVSNAGTIYQKDLGPQTLDTIEKMTEFNPDSTWVLAE